ncbi:hypothetical protein AVHM3334_10720 [Acidovorax sp. SUPP3334]|nr:hypothetical protein AVHM3334_10720 [Acidovorax sp. SUPP3334]
MASVGGDGAYDTKGCHAAIAQRGAQAVIPPRKNGKPWKETPMGAAVRNEALRACHNSPARYCATTAARAAPALGAADAPPAARLPPVALTRRETEVLSWIAKGKTNRDIADILGMSPRTVNKHLEHIFEKLGVETRTAAAALAGQLLQEP